VAPAAHRAATRDRHERNRQRREQRRARGYAITTINQVECVGYTHDPQDRDHQRRGIREVERARERVEHVDAHAAEKQRRGQHHFEQELGPRPQLRQVIPQSDQQRRNGAERDRTDLDVRVEAAARQRSRHEQRRNDQRQHDAHEQRNAAAAWGRARVPPPPAIRYIDHADAHRDVAHRTS
jgi:hypothetical protein